MALRESFLQFVERRKWSAICSGVSTVCSILLASIGEFSIIKLILSAICLICAIFILAGEWFDANKKLGEFNQLNKEFSLYQKHTNSVCDFIRRFWYDYIQPLDNISLNRALIERYEELMRNCLNALTEEYCDRNENHTTSTSVQERFSFYVKLKDDGTQRHKYKCLARGAYDEKLKREHFKKYENGIQLKTEEHPFILRPTTQMIEEYGLKDWDDKSIKNRLKELYKQSDLECSSKNIDSAPSQEILDKIKSCYPQESCEELLKSRGLGYFLYHYKELGHHPSDVANMMLRSTVYIGHRLKQTIKRTSWFGAIVYESTHTSSLQRIDTQRLENDMKNFSDIFSPFLALFRYHIDNVKPAEVIGDAVNESPLDSSEQNKLQDMLNRNSQTRSIRIVLTNTPTQIGAHHNK